ncbi:MAG TPA: hypothetical protein VFK14_06850 [Solirubrobacterales bacterium]|nr:hypothetical protein [Solirubrobacterales bacterium]
MKSLKAGLPVLAATLVLVLPGTALAGAVVPAGNPAAIQYTEAFPTSKGPTDTEQPARQQHPDQALGQRNAERLESEGRDGREAARVAAATAPQAGAAQAAGTPPGSGAGSAQNSGGGGNGGGASHEERAAGGAGPSSGVVAGSDGGSGLGKVARQATGLDTSEGTGLLLPLAILAIVAWGSAFVLRRRKRAAQ